MTPERLPNIHPGEILQEEFLDPMGITQNQLARDIRVPANRINAIVRGQRAVTADTALRLARYFNTSAEFWLGLQMDYDLEEQALALAEELARIAPAPAEAEEEELAEVVASTEAHIEADLEVTGEAPREHPALSEVHAASGVAEGVTLDEALAIGPRQGWMRIDGDFIRRASDDYSHALAA